MRTKFLALFCALFAMYFVANGQNTDLKRLGFKGEIQKVEYGPYYSSRETVYEFDTSGKATNFHLLMGETQVVDASITTRTNTSISGKWFAGGESNTYTLTISNGKITKMTSKDSKGNTTLTYQYNANGEMTRVDLSYVYYTTETYYEGGYSGLDEYERSLNNLANSNLSNLASNYNKAIKAAGRVGYGVRERTKKVKHEDKNYEEFKDYEYDEFGNWVSREYYRNGYHVSRQYRYITYDPTFWSKTLWEKVKSSGDFSAIENFALNPNVTKEYKNIAANYWNANIMNEIQTAYDNKLDSLCRILQSPIVNAENKATLENQARAFVWNNYVLTERDYLKVNKFSRTTIQNWKVFDREYINKIQERSRALRADSIAFLTNKAQAEYDKALYTKAMETSNGILNISQNDQKALELLENSSYKQILKNVDAGTPVPNEMTQYLQTFPQGKYKTEVEDQYATYNLNVLKACEDEEAINKAGGMELINFLRSLPVNDLKLAKSVKKTADKKEFVLKRGDVLDFGLGVSSEYGPDMFGVFGEAGFRIGYLANFVNLYVGGRFGWMSSGVAIRHSEDAKQTVNGGHFELLRASIPVQLRLHLAKKYNSAWYLGLGADLNFNISPKIKLNGAATTKTNDRGQQVEISTGNPRLDDTMLFKDKNLVNKMTYSPRVALGYSGRVLNFELYGVYDLKDTFNKEYLKNNHIENLVHPQFYDGQVNNKWRIGAALRLMF